MCIRDSINAEYMGRNYHLMKFSAIQVLCMSLVLPSTLAWWETGHMTTAQIAKDELIKANPTLYKYLEALTLYGSEQSLQYYKDFQYASVWADDIKDQGFKMFDQWHYMDRPVNEQGFLLNFDHSRHNNAEWIIQQISGALTNQVAINSLTIEKSQMLRFLIHIFGDIHQPLHTSTLFNEEFHTEDGDQGGTQYKIEYNLTSRNYSSLHYFWDSGAGVLPDLHQRPLTSDNFTWVSNYSSYLLNKFPREKLKDQLSKKQPMDWILESYSIARTFVYGQLNGSHVITEDYRDKAYAIVEQRLVLGGYRLCDYLLNLFKDFPIEVLQKFAYQNQQQDTKEQNSKYQARNLRWK
eukprot:TRINITY_DN1817_c0_g3_i3.p1 TRINITY_DN1817_c0_g3~~TRINITY_DN1817_c0_g3_i3.p1  ORF type:complete len:351 (-),score=34.65 TRINITY_DN1817_c0_g3_i3:9-1061(-)